MAIDPLSIGLMAGMAGLSAMQARQQRKAQERQNLAAAEQTRYSPWTGMGAGQIQTGAPSSLVSGLGGGIQGLMLGQQLALDEKKAAAEEK